MRIYHKWKCPNCQTTHNEAIDHDNEVENKLVECDVFEGGCRRQFLILSTVAVSFKLSRLVPIEEKEPS